MSKCIHCGRDGKKFCSSCLETAKNEKLHFLFPLSKSEIAAITKECEPKPVTATTPATNVARKVAPPTPIIFPTEGTRILRCIHCGTEGKTICYSCLETAKNEKLHFLFPLSKSEIAAITKECEPKPVTATTPATNIARKVDPPTPRTTPQVSVAVDSPLPQPTTVNTIYRSEDNSTVPNDIPDHASAFKFPVWGLWGGVILGLIVGFILRSQGM